MDYGKYVSVFHMLEVEGVGGGVMRRHFRSGRFGAETSGAAFGGGFPYRNSSFSLVKSLLCDVE
jgi:hypothetical protein